MNWLSDKKFKKIKFKVYLPKNTLNYNNNYSIVLTYNFPRIKYIPKIKKATYMIKTHKVQQTRVSKVGHRT